MGLYEDARRAGDQAAEAFLAERLTAAVAPVAAERDAAIAARDAAEKAFADHMATVHPPPPVEPTEPTVVELVDFARQSSGMYDRAGFLGEGIGRTVLRMRPNSSTKATSIPTVRNSGTNQMKVARLGGGLGATTKTVDTEVAGFTLEGTDQGHLYGGLLVGWSTRAHVHDVRVAGIPGNDSTPPGETFALAMWHADECVVERVEVDGAAAWSGGSEVTATGIGLNSCVAPILRDSVVRGAVYGMGVAVWDCTNPLLERLDLRGNRRALNFEQAHPGTIVVSECDMRERRAVMPHMTVNSALGSSKVLVHEPVWDEDQGPLWIGVAKVGANYPAGGNKPHTQRVADITVVKDGKDITATSRVRFGY